LFQAIFRFVLGDGRGANNSRLIAVAIGLMSLSATGWRYCLNLNAPKANAQKANAPKANAQKPNARWLSFAPLCIPAGGVSLTA